MMVFRFRKLLQEQNRLRERIRDNNYTKNQWKSLDSEERLNAFQQLFGDKELLKTASTKASSESLENLKTISLDSLEGSPPPDPTEDFTTYTEVDTGGFLSQTTDRSLWTGIHLGADAYLYCDMGIDHFDGDFEHLLTASTTLSAPDIDCETGAWGMANDLGNWYTLQAGNRSGLVLNFSIYDTYGVSFGMTIAELDSGYNYTDRWQGGTSETVYYPRIVRDEAIGTYGTFYVYIYSDPDRTTLLDTLSIVLHSSKKDYRYIYGVISNDWMASNAGEMTGYTEYLDLQEAGGETEIFDSDSAVGQDTKTAASPAGEVFGSETGLGAGTKADYPAGVMNGTESGDGDETASLLAVAAPEGDSGSGTEESYLNTGEPTDKVSSDIGGGVDIVSGRT